jgi:O-methyltransferase involved in polyketide biosynthesis
LSKSDWSEKLIAAGFNPQIPTLFVLEGFINYLTIDEVNSFFTHMTDCLAAQGSRIVMTCGTPLTQASG